MTQNSRNILLLAFIVAIVCLVLLSSGLSNLQLLPGMPLPVVEPQHSVRSTSPQLERTYSSNFWQAVLGLLLLLLMIYVPARLILFVRIRWLFRLIQVLALLLFAVLFFYFIRFDPGCYTAECSQTLTVPYSQSPILSVEGPPQQLVGYVEIILVLAAVLFFFWVFARLFRPRKADSVLLHVEDAVRDIHAGTDFQSVSVQCYLNMAAALPKEHGIERESSMTSREFESLLASKGFPPKPVQELTHLFEKVRYSQDPISREEELAAMNCLSAIIGFAKGKSHG